MSLLRSEQDRVEGISEDCDPWPTTFAAMQSMRKTVHGKEEELEMQEEREVMLIVLRLISGGIPEIPLNQY